MQTTSKSGRREFLNMMAQGAAAMVIPGLWGADEQVIPFLDSKPLNPEKPTMPWDQLTSWITPDEHFFSVAHYGVAEVDIAKWKLEIGGLVERPRVISLDELKSRPSKQHTATLECSGNGPAGGLIGNARWTGAPLAPLLKAC